MWAGSDALVTHVENNKTIRYPKTTNSAQCMRPAYHHTFAVINAYDTRKP
jgi:hypothetical protein